MRRIEYDRPGPFGRLEDFEGRVELVFQFGHGEQGASKQRRNNPARAGLISTIARKALLSMAESPGAIEIAEKFGNGFTRYLPAVWLMQRLGSRRVGLGELTILSGLEDGENHSCRR